MPTSTPNLCFYARYSEFGVTGNASLKGLGCLERFKNHYIPTLRYRAHMIPWIRNTWNGCPKNFLPKGADFYLCPNGSHLSQYDDQKT